MKHKIIYDLSIFIHANYFIQKKILKGKPIDEHKFLKKVASQVNNIHLDIGKKYQLDYPVIAVDSKNFRKENFSEYKGTRDNTHHIQLSALKSFCAEFISDYHESIRIPGLEADDIMYLYANKYKPSIIVSNDNDCKLAMNEGVIFYQYGKKEYHYYNIESFKWYKYHKVLFGDFGDNVSRLVPTGNSSKWFSEFLQENMELSQSEFYKKVSFEMNIPMKDIIKNIHLTNYSEKIYKKYLPNFDELIKDI